MKRLRALLLTGLVIAVTVASAASGQRREPILSRPNPILSQITLDYIGPVTNTHGQTFTSLPPQATAVISASVADLRFLRYKNADDLGGFLPAPIGWLALGTCYPPTPGVACPGENIRHGRLVGGPGGRTQIRLYKNQAHARIKSYTFGHGTGGNHLPHLPQFPPQPPLPLPLPFPGNGCFGGCPTGNHHHTTPSPPPPGKPGDCGIAGISIASNLPYCRIYVVNQAPGDSTTERLTITNTSGQRYQLSFRVASTHGTNVLWDDLEMGIWQEGTTPPSSFPALRDWTTQYTPLVTLDPNQVVHYVVELALPVFAGNRDQALGAVVDFQWRAVARPTG